LGGSDGEPRPGKLEIAAITPLGNQRDLALAYSPGVAFACEAIAADTALSLAARARVTADCRLSARSSSAPPSPRTC
jgi:malic enzyme